MSSAAKKPIVPDYEILHLIGRGAYGEVWFARGLTGLFRAIKIVWRDRFADAEPFEREFRGLKQFAAISLREAGQLALLHVGRDDAAGYFYYVMELADDAETGREIDPARYVPHTLKEMRARRGRISAPECLVLGIQLARALGGLHAHNLVHRDIKPSNVIVVGGVPKLADIGLVASATDAHTFVGTEGFVPPEGPGTPAADVFGLGKLLYEMATGLDRNDYPRLPPDFGQFPDHQAFIELNEVLIRACEPSPAQRYPSAEALLDELLLLEAGRSVRRLHSIERNLGWVARAGLILGLVAVIGGGGALVERRRLALANAQLRASETARADLTRKVAYSAGLVRAQNAAEMGQIGPAKTLLKELAPAAGEADLRGFEWRALWNEAQPETSDLLRGSGAFVADLAYSPDGRLIGALGVDRRLTIWGTRSRRVVTTVENIDNAGSASTGLGFSADSRWWVGNSGRIVQRWSAATGDLDRPAHAGKGIVLCAVGPNRALCLRGGRQGGGPPLLELWDFQSGVSVWTLPLTTSPEAANLSRFAVAPDGSKCALELIVGSFFGPGTGLQIIDLASGRRLYGDSSRVSALAFDHANGRLAAAFYQPDEIRWLELDGFRWTGRGPADNQVNAMAYSRDDRWLYTASDDGLIRCYDARSGSLADTRRGHDAGAGAVAASPGGGPFVSGDGSGQIRIWPELSERRAVEARGLWSFANLYARPLSLACDGRWIAVTLDGHTLRLLDGDDLHPRGDLPRASFPLASSLDSRTLFAVGEENSFQEWTVAPHPVLARSFAVLAGHESLSCAALSANRRILVVGNLDGLIQWWDRPTARLLGERQSPRHSRTVWLAAGPDGALLVAGDDERIAVWRSADGALLAQIPQPHQVDPRMGAISSDGRFLALGFAKGDAEVRALPGLALVHTLRNFSPPILHGLQFIDHDRRLVCCGDHGTLDFFDTNDWREIVPFLPERANAESKSAVFSVDYSESADLLAAYFSDGRLRIWRGSH